jgi:hypothetical protein
VLAIAVPTFAQLFGTVKVSVRDLQNLAVANAAVIIKDKMSEWQQTGTTDTTGRFEILFVFVVLKHDRRRVVHISVLLLHRIHFLITM